MIHGRQLRRAHDARRGVPLFRPDPLRRGRGRHVEPRTFLENTSGYRRDLRRVEYGDERDPRMRAFLEKTAPLNNAEKISKPLFIVQGANDPRVPLSESEQMVAKIRRRHARLVPDGQGRRPRLRQEDPTATSSSTRRYCSCRSSC